MIEKVILFLYRGLVVALLLFILLGLMANECASRQDVDFSLDLHHIMEHRE